MGSNEMKIGIIGWGIEGQSAFKFFGPEHEYLIVSEEPRDDFPARSDKIKIQFLNSPRPVGITGNVKDLSYLDDIENCDKIVYSVTNAKNLEKKFGQDQSLWAKATTVQHIFFETVKSKNIIGVTGTKGKGTTCTLIHHLLEAQGKKVFLGGNIEKSMLDFVHDVQPDDWVVLELSNFQLYKLTYSPHIAVCLMVAEEHMDWHADMDDYIRAKTNLFSHQKSDDIAIYFANNENSKKIALSSPGGHIPFYQTPGARVRDDGMIVIGEDETEIIHKTEVKLLGEHNLQNICAALTAVYEAVGSIDRARVILTSFSGLEHRLEFVRELDGIKYYDDSFGTTPDTAIVALKALPQPKIVILGGSYKGVPFDVLADAVTANNVRHAIVIGAAAQEISNLLRQRDFTNITTGLTNMTDMVTTAKQAARPGDVVLLSTGCASFGLFKDYKDRGNQFKKAVLSLA